MPDVRRVTAGSGNPDAPRAARGLVVVVTTIQPPTPSIAALSDSLGKIDAPLIAIGDRKGPESYPIGGAILLTLEDQKQSGHALALALPVNHYARKNIGYLSAIARGATCIFETDDDNAPLPSWRARDLEVNAHLALDRGWVNAYRNFSGERIWPRGFPLDAVLESCQSTPRLSAQTEHRTAPIQQGLANNSPDVDAIWRLTLDAPVTFENAPSVFLPQGAWCPFNSQSTWWWPEAYALMYLPSYCSFRMTDIWRSFIAQRCLWEFGLGVAFHAPEVVQERNPHDLMRDFTDEIPGYQRNRELAAILVDLSLSAERSRIGDNLRRCYRALIDRDFFPEEEMSLVDLWLDDLAGISE